MTNKGFVIYHSDQAATWQIDLSFESPTANGRHDELLKCIEQLFTAFDKFVRPLELECVLFDVDGDLPATMAPQREHRSNPRVHDLELSTENPYQDLCSVLESDSPPDPKTLLLTRLTVIDASTCFRLADGDQWVSTSSDRYRHDPHQPTDDPAFPPLSFNLVANSPLSAPPSGAISIETHTRIWFNDCEISRTNRERLVEALSTLIDLLGEDVTVSSEFVPSPYDDEILDSIRN